MHPEIVSGTAMATPPAPPLPPTGITAGYEPASFVRRLLNYLIDRVLAFTLMMVGLVAVAFASRWVEHHTGFKDTTLATWVESIVVWCAVYLWYYFWGEWRSGRTLAKYLTGTQVVTTDDQPRTASKIAGRTLARLIPFDELSILFGSRRPWHDSFSHTLVVSSNTLPLEQRPRHGRIVQVAALVLLLLPVGLVTWLVYQAATGGERFDLPRSLPADFRLIKYEEIPDDNARYYVLTYRGQDRTVQITRLIAGYNFDPHEGCVYTKPSRDTVGYRPISKALSCSKIAQGKNLSAYEVTSTDTDPAIQAITPDYYLEEPPYRYTIKAITGGISRQEATKMTDGIATVTAQDLRAQADR